MAEDDLGVNNGDHFVLNNPPSVWNMGLVCIYPNLVITVPADSLAPYGARESADTVLT